LHGVLEEKGAAVDDVALREPFQHEFIALKIHVDLADASLDEDELRASVAYSQHDVLMLVLGLPEREHHGVYLLLVQPKSVIEVLNELLEKESPGVSVLGDALEQHLPVLWVLVGHRSEALVEQARHRVVVSADDRAGPWAAVEQTNFAEVVAFGQQPDEIVLYLALVNLVDDAVTDGDEEELLASCSLLQNDLFWHGQTQV
jgi:hypothetical protein